MKHISRREFAALTVAGTAMSRIVSPLARELGPTAGVTAADIVDRIKKQIGGTWENDDIDAFKIGDPATVVTGVVTTSMATLDVLQKAVQAGANLIITATPTFYSRADLSTPGGRGLGAGGARAQGPARGTGPAPPSPATVSGPGTGASAPMPPPRPFPESVVPALQRGGGPGAQPTPPPPDPVFAGKNEFIAKHKLVVFRLGQHWTQRQPDPRAVGLANAMGWTKYKAGNDALRYDIPPVTLDVFASQLKKTLNARGGIRVVGDPAATVRRIGLLPGYTMIQAAIAMMPTVDVIVTGEVQEWESPTYAQDVAFAGIKKGFISIGRIVNEAPGMQVCADWLKTFVPEVPVRFVPAGDLYWRPL